MTIPKVPWSATKAMGRTWFELMLVLERRPWLAWVILVLCFLNLAVGPPERALEFQLRNDQLIAQGGHSFLAVLEPPGFPWVLSGDTNEGFSNARARLREDGAAHGFPRTQHADIIEKGGGNYSHWGQGLYFSASDNSDPRYNGRAYTLTAYATLDPAIKIINYGFLIIISMLTLIKIYKLYSRPNIYFDFHFGAVKTRGHDIDLRHFVGIILTILPVSWLMAVFIAPRATIDSQVLIAYFIPDTVIPHFGPLYPFFTRSINAIWQGGAGALFVSEANIETTLSYTRGSIALIIFAQHVLSLVACAYFSFVVLSRSRYGVKSKFIMTLAAYLFPPHFIYTHSLLTEAIAFPLLILMVAETVRIGRLDRGFPGAVLRFYFLALLAVLTKHVFVLFFALPFVIIAIRYVFIAWRRSGSIYKFWRITCYTIVVGAIALSTVQIVTQSVLREYGIEARSISGRAFVYRLAPDRLSRDQFFHSDTERLALVGVLVDRADHGLLKRTVEVAATTPGPWVGPYGALVKDTLQHCSEASCFNHSASVVVDLRLNAMTWHAIRHGGTALWRDTLMRMGYYFSVFTSNPAAFQWLLDQNHRVPEYRLNPQDPRFNVSHIDAFPLRFGVDLDIVARVSFWILLYSPLLWLAIGASLFRRDWERVPLHFALLIVACLYAFAMSVATVYVRRYGDVMAILAFLACLIALSASRETDPQPASRRQAEPN